MAIPGTLPYLNLPYFTLPYFTSPYLTSPYFLSSYLTLPYLTLPYLTLPYLTLPYLTPSLSLSFFLNSLSFPFLFPLDLLLFLLAFSIQFLHTFSALHSIQFHSILSHSPPLLLPLLLPLPFSTAY